jgi:hypothetical protein
MVLILFKWGTSFTWNMLKRMKFYCDLVVTSKIDIQLKAKGWTNTINIVLPLLWCTLHLVITPFLKRLELPPINLLGLQKKNWSLKLGLEFQFVKNSYDKQKKILRHRCLIRNENQECFLINKKVFSLTLLITDMP